MAINSTDIVLIISGLASLTPLVKAIGQWHISVKKISNTTHTVAEVQSQVSQFTKRSFFRGRGLDFWMNFAMLLCRSAMVWISLFVFDLLIRSKDSLTVENATMIAFGASLLIIGFQKDSK